MLRIKIQNIKLSFLRIILFFSIITSYELLVTSYGLFALDQIVAVVNQNVITQKDLNDFINFTRVQLMAEYKGEKLESKIQSMKLDLIDRLIEDHLILQEAKKSGIRIDQGRIKARIAEIKKHYVSDRAFQDAISKQGLVQADIEKKIREQLLMQAIIEIKIKSKIIINPSEVTEFYQQNIENFKLPEGREFESLSIKDADLSREVFAKLKSDGDFQEVAKIYSLNVNKFNSTQKGQLRGDIEEEIFKLQPGEISNPIKIEDSYYIFKLNSINPPRQQILSETQDEIYTFLFNAKMQEALANWLEELKKHSYIKISQN
ncbi:MAG: peptidyl-prolyl cis-trans isomerase [Candidatus Omnitrophota bacterium]